MMFMAWQMFLYFLRHFKRKRWGRDTKLCAGNSLMGRLLLVAQGSQRPHVAQHERRRAGVRRRQSGGRGAQQGRRDRSREGEPRRGAGGGRLFAEPRDASEVPTASDHDGVDRRHAVEHGRRDSNGSRGRRGAWADGRSLVDAGVIGAEVAVFVGVGRREEPAPWLVPQPGREAIHQRGGAVHRCRQRHVRRRGEDRRG